MRCERFRHDPRSVPDFVRRSGVARPCGGQPLPEVQKDPAFTACWREEFKKSEAEVERRLRVLAERHRKDELDLHQLMTKAQRAWLLWREAACRVETYESKGGSGFSVYWDRCQIKMNEARAVELQHMIDNP
jgi:uncharacterized protein YecT (DUF1311 family)